MLQTVGTEGKLVPGSCNHNLIVTVYQVVVVLVVVVGVCVLRSYKLVRSTYKQQ